MKKLVISVLVMIAMLATMNSAMAYTYEEPVKSSKLPRTTPLEKGIDPSYLYDMLDQLEQAGIEMHSLLVSVDNEVIFEGFWNPLRPGYAAYRSFADQAVLQTLRQAWL